MVRLKNWKSKVMQSTKIAMNRYWPQCFFRFRRCAGVTITVGKAKSMLVPVRIRLPRFSPLRLDFINPCCDGGAAADDGGAVAAVVEAGPDW